MPNYILLLHSDPKMYDDLTPEEVQKVYQEYMAWREGLKAHGIKPEGQKLRNGAGRVMRESAGKLLVTDGPYAETREQVGGYFAFEAASFEQVVEVANNCPHLRFGSIEIREVEHM